MKKYIEHDNAAYAAVGEIQTLVWERLSEEERLVLLDLLKQATMEARLAGLGEAHDRVSGIFQWSTQEYEAAAKANGWSAPHRRIIRRLERETPRGREAAPSLVGADGKVYVSMVLECQHVVDVESGDKVGWARCEHCGKKKP